MPNAAADSSQKIGLSNILFIAVVLIMAGFLAIDRVYYSQTRELSGLVQSQGNVDSRFNNRGYASIKLENGDTVVAQVAPGISVRTGETVKVLEQKRLFGRKGFYVVSIEPRP